MDLLKEIMDMDSAMEGTVDTSSAASAINEVVETLTTMDAGTRWDYIKNAFMEYLPHLLNALIVLVAGIIIIKIILRIAKNVFVRPEVNLAMHNFLLAALRAVLYCVLGITVAATLGVEVGSLIAVLGVFGLAISLAVKDSLSNLAGGITVLFTKPFAIGDYVTIGDASGTVMDIRLNYTILHTIDNKVINIPSADVAKAQIINFSANPQRRLDLEFSIGYHDDFFQAQQIILELIENHPLALKDPEPVVRMWEHGQSAIKIICRVWVNTPELFSLKFDLLEQVKARFDEAGITIPYNRMVVKIEEPDKK